MHTAGRASHHCLVQVKEAGLAAGHAGGCHQHNRSIWKRQTEAEEGPQGPGARCAELAEPTQPHTETTGCAVNVEIKSSETGDGKSLRENIITDK